MQTLKPHIQRQQQLQHRSKRTKEIGIKTIVTTLHYFVNKIYNLSEYCSGFVVDISALFGWSVVWLPQTITKWKMKSCHATDTLHSFFFVFWTRTKTNHYIISIAYINIDECKEFQILSLWQLRFSFTELENKRIVFSTVTESTNAFESEFISILNSLQLHHFGLEN